MAKFAWSVLGVNILVILWGAYVRATGSGAGCGAHWPLCNGVAIPRSMNTEMVVEFTHRLSSGLAFLLVASLLVAAWRSYPKAHRVRRTALLAMIFMVLEALVGAGLVLFEYVAHDASLGRVITISIHLINTFLLLASLTLTAWFASGGAGISLEGRGLAKWALGLGFAGVLVLGVSGAITALGDTLFPVASLAEGIQQDLTPTAHFLVRLRVWHPVIAIITSSYLIYLSRRYSSNRPERILQVLAWSLGAVILVQLLAGLVNLSLLAPVAMQLIHLFLADLVWIVLVLYAAAVLKKSPTPAEV